MASHASIERKLDELVKQKADAEPKEPTQEEKDEERMREIEAKIADLVELMSSGTTRESADHSVSDAKDRVQTTQGEERPFLRVYHDHGGKRIPTTRRTQVTRYPSVYSYKRGAKKPRLNAFVKQTTIHVS